MLFLQKSTPCGRFTVSITSNVPEASMLLVGESARSLKALSDVLTDAATCALQAAVGVLEAGKAVPAVVAPVDDATTRPRATDSSSSSCSPAPPQEQP